jgi:DNA-binding PadR family transcriptional regulator
VPPTSGLSPRSYAILGLLGIRDWTTHELAQQMERGIGLIWTSARSMVYEEPKQLASLGLAEARTETTGRRTRTRYTITPAGRAVLRDWLAEPGAPPAMQFEGLLKVLLAETSRPGALHASLAEAITWADGVQADGRRTAAAYAAGTGQFQDRAHLVALTSAFLWDYAELVRRWATWAQQQITAGPATAQHDDGVFGRVLRGGPVLPPGPDTSDPQPR